MKDYQKFANQIANQAARLMRSSFQLQMKHQDKDDGSPVTETDLAINRLLIDQVKKTYPTHSVLAEEESCAVTDAEFVWVCDPIDGTIPFSHAMPLATFSLALVHNGEPILGIVVDPFQKNFFTAQKGRGAYLNDKPMKVSPRDTLASSVVFTEYWKQAAYHGLGLIQALEDLNCHVPILKSIAYGATLVGLGEVVGCIFPGKNPWDIAAASLIVAEAGGTVTNLHGQAQHYDREIQGCLLSNGIVHQQLLELVAKNIFNQPN